MDASVWIRRPLESVLRKVLTEMGFAEEIGLAFRTTVLDDGRVRLDGCTGDGTVFAASFRLQPERGAVALKEPIVWVDGKSFLNLRNMWAVPTPLVENLGSLYLSTVVVDAGSAFCVTDITKAPDTQALRVSVVASAASRAARDRVNQRNLDAPPQGRRGAQFSNAERPKHTYYIGENLPWILNANLSPPLAVQFSMAALALMLRLTSLPDDVYKSVKSTTRFTLNVTNSLLRKIAKSWRSRRKDNFESSNFEALLF